MEKVHGPLAVAENENASIEAYPTPLVIHGIVPPVHDHVVVGVLVEGNLKGHVCEDGVAVHPPDPVYLWVLQHEHMSEEDFHPPAGHLIIYLVQVVEELDVVQAAVVHFVFDGFQEHLITPFVRTGVWVRACDQKDERF